MARVVNVNFKLDADIKNSMEEACSEMGISMSAAFKIFAKKVGREKRIPFYSESNMRHLRRGIEALNTGDGKEHEIIEVTE